MTTGIRAGASASEVRLALIEETAWGVTPATPAFKTIRLTSENIQPSKNTVRSNELQPDRNVVDEIQVGRSVAGPIAFELSYATFDDLLRSLLFADWSTNKIQNGAGAGTSFTAERRIALPAGTYEYQRFTGLVANSLSLNINSGGILTGEFGMMGKFGGRGTYIITGATYTAPNTNPVLNATSHFASINIPGLTGTVPRIQSLTMNITNNIRSQNAVGSVDAIGLAPGIFEVTGTITTYFETGDALQAFLDHQDLALNFTVGTAAGSRYKFTIPTIVLTGDPGGNAGGNNEDVTMTLNYTAVLDRLTTPTKLGCTLQIERAV